MGGGSGDSSVTDGIELNIKVVTVNVRCSNGNKFSVRVSLESSVESFKSVLAQNCDIPAAEQRLIYKGRILKDDQTLNSYGLEAEHTVHLVRGFVPATSTPSDGAPTRANLTSPAAGNVGSVEGGPGLGASPFSGLGLGGLGGLGGNSGMFGAGLPELEQMQQQLNDLNQNANMLREIAQNLFNNPDVMRNMTMNNPQMRDVIDRNPELAHMLNDPAILRQTMEAARNPELMRELMRNTDRAMSNIESSPEGFNMLRRMYQNVQEPLMNATTMGSDGDTGNNLNSNPFAALLGGQAPPPRGQVANLTTTGAETTTGSPVPNTNPLPNPWAAGGGTNGAATNPAGIGRAPPVGGLGGLEGLFGGNTPFGGTTPDPNSMSQLMQNPAVSQMMQSLLSNPQYMNQILGLNPQMRNMLESNPQLREMMQNPDFIRQLTSPETMQQMMTLQQSLLSGLGGQQPTRDAGQTGGGIAGAPNNMNLDMLMNMFGGLGTGGFSTPTNTANVPPEELYAPQLAQLQEMGFFDTRENLQALSATAGNVHAAVERLLGNLGQ